MTDSVTGQLVAAATMTDQRDSDGESDVKEAVGRQMENTGE